MPIDPSIALGIKPVQIESPVNVLAQLLQVQGAQQQNQLGQMKLDEHQRGIDRTNRLQSLLSSFAPDAKADDQVGALTRGGFLTEARSLAESSAKVAADKRAAEKAELEGHLKKFEVAGQIMNGVKDQATWERAKAQTAQAFGAEAAAQLPDVYDPALIEQKRMQAMTVKDQLEQVWRQKGYDLELKKADETARHNGAVEKTSAGQLAVSQGQLGVAQQREKREATAPKGQIVQSDNGPILVDPRSGTGKEITGPDGQRLAGVTKPLNDSQSKALLFGTRMQEANSILNDLASKGTTSSVPGSRTPLLGSVVNFLSSDEHQKLDQAKRDFLNATLRRESGAAISPGEFDNGDKQYFPQVGDSKAVIEQKARNRELAARGVLIEVPEKQRGSLAPSKPAPAAAGVPDDIAALLQKHGGK